MFQSCIIKIQGKKWKEFERSCTQKREQYVGKLLSILVEKK